VSITQAVHRWCHVESDGVPVAVRRRELAELAAACKFRDCAHTHEPDCAVRQAVEAGEVPKLRYESYLRIRESLHDPAKR